MVCDCFLDEAAGAGFLPLCSNNFGERIETVEACRFQRVTWAATAKLVQGLPPDRLVHASLQLVAVSLTDVPLQMLLQLPVIRRASCCTNTVVRFQLFRKTTDKIIIRFIIGIKPDSHISR